MSYQVLARKWRPRSFQEMMGQEHVLRALINALDNQRLHHAYLFTGTRGVGKTTVARIFAKSLNCEQGVSSKPCGVCGACREIDDGRFVDLIEVDAASRTKVEDTRELMENVQYTPTSGRYKVYLIDEVHMLSTHSFNALLKTLEEPPPHVKFLLATTDPQRLPVTILSRCLQFNLKRMAPDTIREHLSHVLKEEGVRAETPALAHLARAADGSMRDALSLLDQAIAYGGGEVSEADVRAMLGSIEHGQIIGLAEALAARDGDALLRHSAALAEFAPDYDGVLAELISLLYHVAVAQTVPSMAADELQGEAAARLASLMSPEDVQLFYQIALIGRRDLPLAPHARGGFEMVLLRMLAFAPVSAEAGTEATSAPPTAAPVRASQPPVPKPAAPAPHNRAAAAVAAAAPKAVAGPAVSDADGDDWNALIESMRLHGIARELAVNCSLKAREGDVFHLMIAPAHASLRNSRLEQRLQEALSAYLGKKVKLAFTVAAPEAETPALMKERVGQDRLRAAHDAIAQDGNIKTLQDMFEARVVPESVQPLD